jgi:hypothetical protein
MYLQKVISRKTFFYWFFEGVLKINDEKQDPDADPDPNPDAEPDPNPDPLSRGMDPRIQIRIHTKMSWIRNTD